MPQHYLEDFTELLPAPPNKEQTLAEYLMRVSLPDALLELSSSNVWDCPFTRRAFNMSQIRWVLTANYSDGISPRFLIAVASSRLIIRNLMTSHGRSDHKPAFNGEDVIDTGKPEPTFGFRPKSVPIFNESRQSCMTG